MPKNQSAVLALVPRPLPKQARSKQARPKQVRPKQVRPKQERGLETRDLILDAVVALIAEQGYAAASTPNIAARAGVSRGALQHHFPSRDALVIAVSQKLTDRMALELSTHDLLGMDTKTRVSHIVDQYWAVFGSVDSIVTLQVRLNEPVAKTQSHRAHMTDIATLRAERERDWLRIFADADATTEQIIAARRFTQTMLRGLSLHHTSHMATTPKEVLLDFLKAALTEMLKPAAK